MSTKNNPSLREHIAELETLMTWFEQDDLDIEQALEKFKQADSLAKKIEKRLSSLENEVTVLKQRFDEPS
jgi:exodeoxyribonuclease VII small subunit